MDPKDALEVLNNFLKDRNIFRELYICGGSAQILSGMSSRNATRDVDVLSPMIDSELKESAVLAAEKIGVDSDWINNGPSSLADDLEPGWESRAIEVFCGSNLIVYSISRLDILFAKIWAYADRNEQRDLEDILSLNPTEEEIYRTLERIIPLDGNPGWPEHLDNIYKELIDAL